MTEAGPLSRIVRIDALPKEGQTVTIEANPAEREALASLYKLPAIAALSAASPLAKEPWAASTELWAVPKPLLTVAQSARTCAA